MEAWLWAKLGQGPAAPPAPAEPSILQSIFQSQEPALAVIIIINILKENWSSQFRHISYFRARNLRYVCMYYSDLIAADRPHYHLG